MNYCRRCILPENTRPTLLLDDEGVCSACRYHESRQRVDWDERWKKLEQLLDGVKDGEVIVPVSGGKDSHLQVWLLTQKFGIKPLLVTYSHGYNTAAGNRNLENLVKKSGCDLVRYHTSLDSARKLSLAGLKRVGDVTLHYHSGIRIYPHQVAVHYNIPLMIWGEHGYAESVGLVSLNDFPEFTNWSRREHDQRGMELTELIGEEWITEADLRPFIWPKELETGERDVRGIYLSNFMSWSAFDQVRLMMREWDFQPVTHPRERTFVQYTKIEDWLNAIHNFLAWVKFGYGRATEEASLEIRHGRMTREEGIRLARKYDPVEPSTLESYCDFLGITKADFYGSVERQEQTEGPPIDGESVEQSEERTFAYPTLYFDPENPPPRSGDPRLDELGEFQPI